MMPLDVNGGLLPGFRRFENIFDCVDVDDVFKLREQAPIRILALTLKPSHVESPLVIGPSLSPCPHPHHTNTRNSLSSAIQNANLGRSSLCPSSPRSQATGLMRFCVIRCCGRRVAVEGERVASPAITIPQGARSTAYHSPDKV